jgi:hypothetical protein
MKARVHLVIGVFLYISAFLFSYEEWVVPRYEDWGMGSRDVPIEYIISSWVFCLIPSLWMPINLSRPSQLLFCIQYFIIFIPASFVIYNSVRPELDPEQVFYLVLSLFSGLSIIQASYSLKLFQIKQKLITEKLFWSFFGVVTFSILINLFMVFGDYFQLADFQDIYDVRQLSDEISEASESSFSGYSKMWLSGFILPFMFSVGVFRRNWILVAIVAAGYVYLLGISGSKSTMLAIIYLSAIYFLVRSGGKDFGLKILLGLSFLLIFPFFIVLTNGIGGLIDKWYVAIIHARIFTIPQLSIGQYYDFFQNQPLTYGSHINGINLVVPYPYEGDIPRTIGRYFYDAELTANVNMWAQDGIASFGLIGIPIVSAIAALIFWFFDSIARLHDPRFVTVALGNIALSFANISLFTTIVSAGFLLLIIALYFFTKE